MVFFSKNDVVRHKLVQEIIKAYEELEKDRNGNENGIPTPLTASAGRERIERS